MKDKNKLAVIDGETLMDMRLVPTKFCVDTLLPQGICMLVTKPMYETTLKQSNAMYDGIIRFPIYLFFSELCYNVNRVV